MGKGKDKDKRMHGICFMCLKHFSKGGPRRGAANTKPEEVSKAKEDLSGKFIVFTEQYLEIPVKEFFFAEFSSTVCPSCCDFVSLLCDIYDDLRTVQRKLSKRIGQLAELLERSNLRPDGDGRDLSEEDANKSLLIKVAKQLSHDDSVMSYEKVDGMRMVLTKQCKIHCTLPLRRALNATFCSEASNDIEDLSSNNNSDDDDEPCEDFHNTNRSDEDSDENDDLAAIKVETELMSGSDTENSQDECSNSANETAASEKKDAVISVLDTIEEDSSEMGDEDSLSGSDSEWDEDTKSQNSTYSTTCSSSSEDSDSGKDVKRKRSSKQKSEPPSADCNDNYKCDICQRSYSRPKNFAKHMHKMHGVKIDSSSRTTCDQCQKTFSSNGALTVHKKNMHSVTKMPQPKTAYFCATCKTYYKSKESLQGHSKRTHGVSISFRNTDKPFKCGLCASALSTDSNLARHMKDSHGVILPSKKVRKSGPRLFPCTLCPKSYNYAYALENHLSRRHQQNMNFKCTQCSMELPSRRLLAHHIYDVHKRHKKSTSFLNRIANAVENFKDAVTEIDCAVCDKKFTSWEILRRHLDQKHEKVQDNEKTLKCYFCSHSFVHEQSIWAHLRSSSSHNFSKMEFPCDHPDHLGHTQWVYKSLIELQDHVQQEHSDSLVINCEDCRWPFMDKNMLNLHRLLHLPKVNKKHQCPMCQRYFLNEGTFQNHYNTVHGVSLKRYRCHICTFGFATKHGYNTHFRTAHEKEMSENAEVPLKPFTCLECDKSYGTAFQLLCHRRSFHVTKQCEECGIVLPIVKYNYHVKRMHKILQHLCTICGKAYRSASDLKVHMFAHGQTHYRCQYCGKGSRSGNHLRRHIGRMHKDKINTPQDGMSQQSQGTPAMATLTKEVETGSEGGSGNIICKL